GRKTRILVDLSRGGVRCRDIYLRRSRDGILVRAEEEKRPPILLALPSDRIGDLLPRVVLGRIFQAISEDGDDHLHWAILLGQRGQARAKFVDRPASRVQ